ncbi:hypothetical protein VULLAG_LOCUS9951 [Vulpes lagopus]
MSFISLGSSALNYRVSSGLLSSVSSLPTSQASSCQNIPVDGNVQSGVQSNTSPQEDKAGGKVKAGDQVAKGEQPAQMCMPL